MNVADPGRLRTRAPPGKVRLEARVVCICAGLRTPFQLRAAKVSAARRCATSLRSHRVQVRSHMSSRDERVPLSRLAASLPLLERSFEVGALAQAIDGGCGGDGQMALLEGSSGIGKTRLLETAAVLAGERGADVFRTCGGELERDYPFGLVRRLLEANIARAVPAQREAVFRGYAKLAESLLQPPPHEEGPALADEFQLIHSLYWLVVNLADKKPLVLIADDLQWGDDLSLRFLLYLAQRLNDLPITLIGAVRTGDPSTERELVTRLMLQADLTLRPSELSAGAVKQLLTALVPEIAD